jgi:hypothetical protein
VVAGLGEDVLGGVEDLPAALGARDRVAILVERRPGHG